MPKPKKNYKDTFVLVSSRSYGNSLKGLKVYYEGKKPNELKKDGSISFGKNILETLNSTFKKYHWIITEDTDEITESYGITRVRTSIKTIKKMYNLSFSKSRDVKIDIIQSIFTKIYPKNFKTTTAEKYKPGLLSIILSENILGSINLEDKESLNEFLPKYIAKESLSTINILKAETQIKTLKEIAEEIQNELKNNRTENWWQAYIHKNILIIQQGYLQAIEKMNISIGSTKFPDYSLVTFDGFLDVLEIKKPQTVLIKEDTSRNNFFWDTEISKAIIQVENYIETISKNAESVRGYIKDNFKIDLKVVRPKGTILAGEYKNFNTQKQKDDFRLLTQANKNITFLTYDELVTRLENYIEVLEKYSSPKI